MSFVRISGETSGTLARVIPILAFDGEILRLQCERFPSQSFSLNGIKKAFSLLEFQFRNFSSTSGTPSIILEFSPSRLLNEYRLNNMLITEQDRIGPQRNLGRVITTLLNMSPPDAEVLLREGSGVGRVTVFLTRIRAEFKGFCKTSGDKLYLDGFESNLLRVASDFFWADFVCGFLDNNGVLSDTMEAELITKASNIVTHKRAVIPDHILEPLFKFMRYTIIGVLHLNEYASGSQMVSVVIPRDDTASLKRKRIVQRLSRGYTGAKRRCFQLSRLKDALRDLDIQMIERQITILETQVVVTRPSRRSVELTRRFSTNARNYLCSSCSFTEEEFEQLAQNNTQLID